MAAKITTQGGLRGLKGLTGLAKTTGLRGLRGLGLRAVALGLVGVISISCSTIRPEHCPYADWQATGELHASKGFQSRLPSLVETCTRVGIMPDGEAYIAGYQQGLLRFCTIENGWVWGQSRDVNPGICPPALRTGFDRAFKARATLEQLDRDESNLLSRRDQLEDQMGLAAENPYTTYLAIKEVQRELDRLDTERRNTRIGFATWLKAHGLEPPVELFKY